jgi:hypothetical protein
LGISAKELGGAIAIASGEEKTGLIKGSSFAVTNRKFFSIYVEWYDRGTVGTHLLTLR